METDYETALSEDEFFDAQQPQLTILEQSLEELANIKKQTFETLKNKEPVNVAKIKSFHANVKSQLNRGDYKQFLSYYNAFVDELNAMLRAARAKRQIKPKPIKEKVIEEKPIKETVEETIKPASKTIFETLKENSECIFNIMPQSNILIEGVTKSGKSTMIANMFSEKTWAFGSLISNVYLFSKIGVQDAWSTMKNNLKKLNIPLTVYDSLESIDKIKNEIEAMSVLIIDDFMVDAIKDKKLMSLFTDLFNVTTHHRNIISIFTLHNLFADGFRTIRLNSDYIFLFSNPVDINSTKVFFRQLESPEKSNYLFEAYRYTITKGLGFGIRIKKNLEHEYYYGFSGLINFLSDNELNTLKSTFQLRNGSE